MGSPSITQTEDPSITQVENSSIKQTENFAHRPHPQEVTNKPKKAWHKQDPAQTTAAALEDSQHRIYISDAFLDLEHQDEETVEKVERQEASASAEARILHPVLTD